MFSLINNSAELLPRAKLSGRSLLHEGALSRSEFATAHSGHSDGFEWAPQGGQNFTPHQSAEVAMREGVSANGPSNCSGSLY